MKNVKTKAIQLFTDEYLDHCRKIPIGERLKFLEDFRLLHAGGERGRSKLISLRLPENLLRIFKMKAEAQGKRYQTKIKELMTEYLSS